MFKNVFSFDGRIRRMEYGLSYIIYIVALFIVVALSEEDGPSFMLLLYLPIIWFLITQRIKRCHDLGNSGWWQLIPFYGLWLLFVEGDSTPNEYGPNPKDPYGEQFNPYAQNPYGQPNNPYAKPDAPFTQADKDEKPTE